MENNSMDSFNPALSTVSFDQIWAPIAGLEQAYEVSNMGRVRAMGPRGKQVAPREPATGQIVVRLWHAERKTYISRSVPMLVASAFLGPPPIDKPIIRHKDGDKFNNSVANLEWAAYSRTPLQQKAHEAKRAREAIKAHNEEYTGSATLSTLRQQQLVQQRLDADVYRLRAALMACTPSNIYNILGTLYQRLPATVLSEGRLEEVRDMQKAWDKAGNPTRDMPLRPLFAGAGIVAPPPLSRQTPPEPVLYAPAPVEAPPTEEIYVEPPPPDAPPLPAVTFAPEERAAALIAEWADHE